MQVNWHHHQHRLGTPWTALEPYQNIRVGSRIRLDEYRRTGNWHEAIGRYHAPGSDTSAPAPDGTVSATGREASGDSRRGSVMKKLEAHVTTVSISAIPVIGLQPLFSSNGVLHFLATQYLRTKGIKPQFPNGIVSSVSFVSTTNTARSLAGFVSLALALTPWRSPGSSVKLCPAS